MPFNLDENSAKYQIRGYKPGQIQINDKILTRSLIISANILIEEWAPQTIEQLEAKDFASIIELSPAILLIGTGEHQVFPPLDIYSELIQHGIGVEVMSTSAAARTYNALTAEERNVVAALIL